eukprot:4640009-Prymnesium_polylepis.1
MVSDAGTQTDETVLVLPSTDALLNGARSITFLCALAVAAYLKSATLGLTLLVLFCAHQVTWKLPGFVDGRDGGRASQRRRTRRNSRSDVSNSRLDRVSTPDMKSREERRSRDRLLRGSGT